MIDEPVELYFGVSMKWVLPLIFCYSAYAHKIEQSYQYWWIKGPNQSSYRYDIAAQADLSLSETLLLGATQFERFNEVDRQIFIGFRKKWNQSTLEFGHRDGGHNQVLAQRESFLTYARSIGTGISLWGTLRAQRFLTNDVHLATLGIEKEWADGLFAVASFTGGQATYTQDTSGLWGSLLKLGKYKEDNWKVWGFLAMGEEGQALASRNQSSPLRVVSYGVGIEEQFKSFELGMQLERSYYQKIQTRFESILIYLNYAWGKR